MGYRSSLVELALFQKKSTLLFVAQSFDRVKLRGLLGRIVAEEDADADGEDDGGSNGNR